jgi:hypothetical protein
VFVYLFKLVVDESVTLLLSYDGSPGAVGPGPQQVLVMVCHPNTCLSTKKLLNSKKTTMTVALKCKNSNGNGLTNTTTNKTKIM